MKRKKEMIEGRIRRKERGGENEEETRRIKEREERKNRKAGEREGRKEKKKGK